MSGLRSNTRLFLKIIRLMKVVAYTRWRFSRRKTPLFCHTIPVITFADEMAHHTLNNDKPADESSAPQPASSPHPLSSHPPVGGVGAALVLLPGWLEGVGLEGGGLGVCLGVADWLIVCGAVCLGVADWLIV